MQISGFSLWLRVILVRVWQGRSFCNLTLQWCEAEPLCWTLCGLLPNYQVWWLGQGYLLMIVLALGAKLSFPYCFLGLWVNQLNPLDLKKPRASPGQGTWSLYSLWRKIWIFRPNCSEDSGIIELQVITYLYQKWNSDLALSFWARSRSLRGLGHV